MTEEQKQAARDRLAKARAAKAAKRLDEGAGTPTGALPACDCRIVDGGHRPDCDVGNAVPPVLMGSLPPGKRSGIQMNMNRDRGLIPSKEEYNQLMDMAATFKTSGFYKQYTNDTQVLTVMLKGWELGIPPQQALQGFYVNEEGKLSMQADLMRAVVMKSGAGVIVPIDMTEAGCVVEATRYGIGGRPDQVVKVSYVHADAARANLLGQGMWNKYPRQCYMARATSEACRALFSDVLLGMVYTPEEIGGGDEAVPKPGKEGAGDNRVVQHAAQPPLEPAKSMFGDDKGMKMPPVAPEAPQEAANGKDHGVGSPPLQPEAQKPSVAVQKVSGRPLTHRFNVEMPGGGIRVVETGGITKGQLTRIGDLTTARGGQDGWEGRQAQGREWLKGIGVSDLKFLTEEEGGQLVGLLGDGGSSGETRMSPAAAKKKAAPKTKPDQLTAVLAECKIEHLREQVITMIEMSYGKKMGQLAPADLAHACVELRSMAREPETFQLMLERALAQAQVAQ